MNFVIDITEDEEEKAVCRPAATDCAAGKKSEPIDEKRNDITFHFVEGGKC